MATIVNNNVPIVRFFLFFLVPPVLTTADVWPPSEAFFLSIELSRTAADFISIIIALSSKTYLGRFFFSLTELIKRSRFQPEVF